LAYIFAQRVAKFYLKLIGGESTFVTFSLPDFAQETVALLAPLYASFHVLA